jgi:hypothetical protein
MRKLAERLGLLPIKLPEYIDPFVPIVHLIFSEGYARVLGVSVREVGAAGKGDSDGFRIQVEAASWERHFIGVGGFPVRNKTFLFEVQSKPGGFDNIDDETAGSYLRELMEVVRRPQDHASPSPYPPPSWDGL